MTRFKAPAEMVEDPNGDWVPYNDVADFFELQDQNRALSAEYDKLSTECQQLRMQLAKLDRG